MPALCQTCESSRAFPAWAWLVVPERMWRSPARDGRARPSREETEAPSFTTEVTSVAGASQGFWL